MANENKSRRNQTVFEAHRDSDIDGYGDEGEGYDYEKFADALEAAGWQYHGSEEIFDWH